MECMTAKKFIRCTPHLAVKNLKQTIDYYRDTLGFTDEWTFGNKDGGVCRDEMRMLFGEDPGFTYDINNNNHHLALMWFVNNIEDVYDEFQKKGIPIADHLKIHLYGLREFAFTDINGYYIRIAEPAGE